MTKLTLLPVLAVALMATGASAQEDKQSAAAENFKQADADEDGKLSKKEFRTFIDLNAEDNLGRASMVKSYGMYDRAFARVDANQDGFVAREEIKAMAGG
ncbi:MAG: hypothetical protein AAFR64_01730 [Pseudomonadota bacterium]